MSELRVKRYLLFAGDMYYPRGGMYDERGSFDTIEEAIEVAKSGSGMIAESGYDWWHVVDTETMDKVAEGRGASRT